MGTHQLKQDAATVAAVLLFSLILFNTVTWYEPYLYRVFSIDTFLTWHMVLELLSIVMSSAIFFITYYTFERSHRLRSIVLACTFLAVALVDLFHTLSYKGMPVFLTESSIAKATTFWILARLIAGFGLLAAAFIPHNKLLAKHRFFPIVAVLALCGALLYAVTYCLEAFPVLYAEDVGLAPLKIQLEYLIIALHVAAAVFFVRHYLTESDERGYLYIILGLVVGIFSELAFTQYHSIYDTYNLLGHLYKIVAYYLLFRALFVLNVQIPYQVLREAEQQLSSHADTLEQEVLQRTREIAAANERILGDLDYARNIQRALLPTTFPKTQRLDFAAKYLPCEKVGGDFYNVYRLDDDHVGILIGDVAGHGVSAAMITVFIDQNIVVRREAEDGRIRILTPKQVLTNLYYVYNRMTFPDEIYTVLFYGILNTETGVLTYASAGMNTWPLILDARGQVDKLSVVGLPICRMGTYITPSYENLTRTLHPGDALILFTDGLVEIDRSQPEIFSEQNVMEYLRGLRIADAGEIVEELSDAYEAILGGGPMLDDVTILVVRLLPEGP